MLRGTRGGGDFLERVPNPGRCGDIEMDRAEVALVLPMRSSPFDGDGIAVELGDRDRLVRGVSDRGADHRQTECAQQAPCLVSVQSARAARGQHLPAQIAGFRHAHVLAFPILSFGFRRHSAYVAILPSARTAFSGKK